MWAAILISVFLFFWFVGFDLLAALNGDQAKSEAAVIRKLQRRRDPSFERHRTKLEPLLLGHLDYYRKLPEASRIKFMLRTLAFMQRKNFTGLENLEVTPDMKVLISASAVQLTFGLQDFLLEHFHSFIIYPDVYTSASTGRQHRGETSMKGMVVLSWKHFLEGYADSQDRLNLGLHELAHALDLSRIVREADPFFHAYFVKWQAVSGTFIREVNEQEEHFLRRYAGTNEREFFAVSVEHFFEDPAGFRQELPHLYRHLTVLLRQDPVALHSGAPSSGVSPEAHNNSLLTDVKYRSPFAFWYACKGLLLPLVLYLYFLLLNPDSGDLTASVLFGLFFLFGLWRFFQRARVIVVTAGYVHILSVFSDRPVRSCSWEHIISIRHYPKRGNGISMTVIEKDQASTFFPGISLSRKEYERLKEALSNQDIMMSV
ncbi:MAG: zinc-dependent peptidase [Bacteroidia bacterium]|nr:zinc-dependent peptidase [Bacteroidia bacterium]